MTVSSSLVCLSLSFFPFHSNYLCPATRLQTSAGSHAHISQDDHVQMIGTLLRMPRTYPFWNDYLELWRDAVYEGAE
jgi:hypothetical protein